MNNPSPTIRQVVVAGFAAALGALLVSMERSRMRRTAAASAVRAGGAARPEVAAASPHRGSMRADEPAAATILGQERAVAAPPDRRLSHAHTRLAPRVASRLPRATVLAGLMLVGLPVVFALARSGGQSAAAPTLAAEAVDTQDGVVVMARAQHFAPNSDVALYWHQPGRTAIHAKASPSGEVLAAVALPPTDHGMTGMDGMLNLIATDGTRLATVSFAPVGGTASAVLAATSSSRIMVNGNPYFLLGANYPWVSYGNDFGSNAWGSYGVHAGGSYAADFADMKAKGVHVARWWVFADGRAGINFAPDGTPVGVQTSVYADLNQALALAKQNNIYLDLVLFDVSMLAQPSNYGGVQMGGHTDAFADPVKRAALVNNVIRPLAKTYAQDPMILSWELMNEPEWGISDLSSPAVNSGYVPVTMAQFWSFASSASQIIHLYTQDQVTIGSAALKWNKVWTNAFAAKKGLPALNLDFYQTHYYPWMDCCSTTNDPDLGTTTWSPLTQSAPALGLDRPIVVGEIHTPSGGAGPQLDQILANGYAGLWAWSYKWQNTSDQLQVDWSTFTPWEAAHANIVRVPPPASAQPSATATNAVPTATPAAPTATQSAPSATPPPQQSPTSAPTRPATATAPAGTATMTPAPTATPAPLPTATSTTAPTPTGTAVPPPTATVVAVPFGRTSAAGFNDSSDWGYLNGSLASLPTSGSINSLSVYVGSTTGTARIRLALYSDVSGMPGLLLAQTGAASAHLGWNTLPTTATPAVSVGAYWIVAQTDDPGTVYRMATALPSANAVGWAAQPYGAFPQTAAGWVAYGAQSFSMYGTVTTNAPTLGVGTPVAPPVRIPPGETITPIIVPTATPTPKPAPTTPPTPASTPTTTPSGTFEQTVCATKLDPSGQSQCGSSTGNGFDYFFCDRWIGGFCDDFRTKQTTTHTMFPMPGDPYSFDALSTTGPQYDPDSGPGSNAAVPCCIDGTVPMMPGMYGFTAYEHFMTAMADSNFGDALIRLKQPFDFAGRTGHIHLDVDTKTSLRRYVRVTLSPELTKRGTDDRSGSTGGNSKVYPATALDIWFKAGPDGDHIVVTENKNGGCGSGYCFGNIATSAPFPTGFDNVRDHVDVYVSRTHLTVQVNGATVYDSSIPDIGFDRAYVYFQQASYNPCKDGTGGAPPEVWPNGILDQCTVAAQQFHWDNFAFDGPVLPTNSLTPAGSEDVVFNAYSATSCTVKGVAAQSVGQRQDYNWITWIVRLPAGTPVNVSDISCSYSVVSGGSDVPRGLEVVTPGG
ncbi:MAG: glycoside hydrolase 5 family protein [Dehalococcoidia bacterium]